MTPHLALLTVFCFAISGNLAHARDLGPDEALRLRAAGVIQSFGSLNATAMAEHPGGAIIDAELESEYGKYVYQVELRDTNGIEWDLELDAVTGQITKNHQDN